MTVGARWPAVLLAALACSLTACPSHVTLEVPPANAPFAEREAAYGRLHPVIYTEVRSWNGPRRFDYLLLADGTRVAFAEDVLLAVPPDCETARAVNDAKRLEATRTWLGVSAVAAFAVGLTLGALSFSKDRPPHGPLLWSGVGVLGGGIGLAFGAGAAQSRAMDATEAAFSSYDVCLQRRLSVCVEPACGKDAPAVGAVKTSDR